MLHVLNGDATRERLARARVPGEMTVWADVLHDGPVPGDVSADEFRRVRARHLASCGNGHDEEIEQRLREWDAALDRFRDYGEVVFWFEHDLFDQLILIRHLHWLAHQHRAATMFSLICIGEFPGVKDFSGLGQLQPGQLASLLETRTPISDAEIDLGRRAWELFTGQDPIALETFRREDTSALPFLEGALRRHLEDFPWTRDGLSRSQRQILHALTGGASTMTQIFRAAQTMEERIFMGDITFWRIVRHLAEAQHPLVTISSASNSSGPLADDRVRMTITGRDVLDGRADHLELNGIDRWMGGVHLRDGSCRWNGELLIADW